MKIKYYIYIISISYFATFLRFYIDNNFVISILGSFFFGFFVARRLSSFNEKILLCGFCSCFTSFSGFIFYSYNLFQQGDILRFFLIINMIIIFNLFIMYLGFFISRKIT